MELDNRFSLDRRRAEFANKRHSDAHNGSGGQELEVEVCQQRPDEKNCEIRKGSVGPEEVRRVLAIPL